MELQESSCTPFHAEPVHAEGTGNGSFASIPSGNGYDAFFSLPISAEVVVGSGLTQATVTANGSIVARGFFTISTVPETTSGLFLVSVAVIAGAARRNRRS